MLFPVNELRNMATMPARTQLLLYVDGDLLLDQTWSKAFREQPAKWVPCSNRYGLQGYRLQHFLGRMYGRRLDASPQHGTCRA